MQPNKPSLDLQPRFVSASNRTLFLLDCKPPGHLWDGRCVIVVPALGEEMNRCRRMVFLQASQFAEIGVRTMIVDLFGTGDSSGDFSEATWEQWVDDVNFIVGLSLAEGSNSVILLGIRTGCWLTLQCAERAKMPVQTLIFWQPIPSGAKMVTELLRVRLAASMMSGGSKESMENLRRALDENDCMEIAGYTLASSLVNAVSDLRMIDLAPPVSAPVRWFEVVADASRQPARAVQRVIESWREAGVSVDRVQVVGESFWATQEITLAPALLDQTTACLV